MLKVAYAQRVITPKDEFFPCYLCGHAIRVDQATGVMHDIHASVIVINIDSDKLVMISLELAMVNKEQSDMIREAIADKYNVPVKNITVSFVHTHSGPECSDESPFFGKEKAQVPGYFDWVAGQVFDAVDECFHKEFTEVKAYMKSVEIEGCYSNRNGKEKPADKSLTTVEFRDGKKVIAGFYNIACHPTVLGPQNLLVDPDLAGYISRTLQKKWGVYGLCLQGAAGDMGNRQYRQGNDENELNRIGSAIMEQYLLESEETELLLDKLVTWTYCYDEEFQLDAEEAQKQYDDILAKIENATTYDEKKVYTSSLAVAKQKLGKTSASIHLECSYYQMGDMEMWVMPAELFSRFGIQIKRAMRVCCPIFWGYSNYSVGYLFNQEDKGASFESAASDYPAGITEKITEDIINFMNAHKLARGGGPAIPKEKVVIEEIAADQIVETEKKENYDSSDKVLAEMMAENMKVEKPDFSWRYKKSLFVGIAAYIFLMYSLVKDKGIEGIMFYDNMFGNILAWIAIFIIIWRLCVSFTQVFLDKKTKENQAELNKAKQFHDENDIVRDYLKMRAKKEKEKKND